MSRNVSYQPVPSSENISDAQEMVSEQAQSSRGPPEPSPAPAQLDEIPESEATPMLQATDNSESHAHNSRKPTPAILRVTNDGVFSNISAKPELEGQKDDEMPPSYEQAAADATPPYFETTIIAPGFGVDEILVDGMPVGNFFGFVWNMLVSMSFQFVGFLLTYLLHTNHAAKNGSRAGLGITLVQFGFLMRTRGYGDEGYYTDSTDDDATGDEIVVKNVWVSYFLMAVGWFIVIRSVSDYIRAKKMEAVILSSPESAVV